MAEDAKEQPPVSPEEAPSKPNYAEAPAPVSAGPRKRKQVDFFAPADVKSPEKLVIKEVRAETCHWALPVTHTVSCSDFHPVTFPGYDLSTSSMAIVSVLKAQVEHIRASLNRGSFAEGHLQAWRMVDVLWMSSCRARA